MRIAKNTLYRRWAWMSGLSVFVFLVLTALDTWLKAATGHATADLSGLSALQLQLVFYLWSPAPHAALAGFVLGFGYLFMPLYAGAFFYSGVVAADAFALKPGLPRRLLGLATMVPLVGAFCNAAENALEIGMLVSGPHTMAARLAATAGEASLLASLVGLALFALALVGRFARPKPTSGSALPPHA